MRRLHAMILGLVGLASITAGCPKPAAEEHGDEHTEEHEEHVDEPAHGELPTRVQLAPELAEAAGIVTTAVRREVLVRTVRVVGQIEPDPDRVSRIGARIAGTLASIEFREGDLVTAGQRLATIRAPDLGSLRAQRTSTAARLAAAKAQLTRLEGLEAKRLAAAQDVVVARATVAELEADLAGASQQLRALDLGREQRARPGEFVVVAPRAGVVIGRSAVVGDPVTPDTVLGTIADLGEVYFAARVFERDLDDIHLGATTEVTLNAYRGDPFVGTIEHIGYVVDDAARTILARVLLRNRDAQLRVGLFGTAAVALSEPSAADPVLVVARSALTQIGGESVVFVREPDGHYEVHPVVLGASSPGKLEIVHGLREGEEVVTEGVFTLKSTMLRSTFAEEHH
jgi:cobalt-zinc-cadmium efflux system membrane fusion protein